jgi:hypothetical protein
MAAENPVAGICEKMGAATNGARTAGKRCRGWSGDNCRSPRRVTRSVSAGLVFACRSSVSEMTGRRIAASTARATSCTPMAGSRDFAPEFRRLANHAAPSRIVTATHNKLKKVSTIRGRLYLTRRVTQGMSRPSPSSRSQNCSASLPPCNARRRRSGGSVSPSSASAKVPK